MKLRLAICAAVASAVAHPGVAFEYLPLNRTSNSFEIRSDETESDTLLRLVCMGNHVDMRLGGELRIGKGKLELVTVKLSSSNATETLRGVSVESPDAEMTSGTELLTSLPSSHRAFAILTQAGPVQIQPAGGKAHKVELGRRAAAGLKAFLEKCR
jgi:hypothetical protein